MPRLGDRVLDAERRLNESREQLRSLERQAQEATFSQRTLHARRAELVSHHRNRQPANQITGR